MRTKLNQILLCVSICILFISCNTTDGDLNNQHNLEQGQPASLVVGPDGGVIQSGDGKLILNLPEGALDGQTEISIEPDVSIQHPWAVEGTVYQFKPEGLQFNTDATLTIIYDDQVISSHDPERGLALFKITDDEWQILESQVDINNNNISAQISGFSRFGIRAREPQVDIILGNLYDVSLVPFISAFVKTNATMDASTYEAENKTEKFMLHDLTPFHASPEKCNLLFPQLHIPTMSPYIDTYGNSGDASVELLISSNDNMIRFQMYGDGKPHHIPGHNTTGSVGASIDFHRLDPFFPLSRTLAFHIDNPGSVIFDLEISWILEGGVQLGRSPSALVSAEAALLTCGQEWRHIEVVNLFLESTVAPPIGNGKIEASDIRSFPNVSGDYVQLWLGMHAAVEAKPAHGDEEGTLGYGHAESSQASLTGVLIVRVTPP